MRSIAICIIALAAMMVAPAFAQVAYVPINDFNAFANDSNGNFGAIKVKMDQMDTRLTKVEGTSGTTSGVTIIGSDHVNLEVTSGVTGSTTVENSSYVNGQVGPNNNKTTYMHNGDGDKNNGDTNTKHNGNGDNNPANPPVVSPTKEQNAQQIVAPNPVLTYEDSLELWEKSAQVGEKIEARGHTVLENGEESFVAVNSEPAIGFLVKDPDGVIRLHKK